MQFDKKTMLIEINVSDEDSIPALLRELGVHLEGETVKGLIRKKDGDEISWEIHSKQVEV